MQEEYQIAINDVKDLRQKVLDAQHAKHRMQ